MTILQSHIKILWGRAASRCAFPDCKIQLTQDSQSTSKSFSIGEQAHIVAKESNHLRGDSILTPDERDSYDNLILLCPSHHTIIDKNPQDYPVEKLHSLKTDHELWVEQNLSQTVDLNQQARDIIYTSLIDSAVEFCHFSQWKNWTFRPLLPIPQWSSELIKNFEDFRVKVLKTDFPGTLTELESSVKTLSILLYNATQVFYKHCEIKKDSNGNLFYEGVQFYKIPKHDTDQYRKLGQEFDDWVEECHQLIIDATKAANWFREVVRRDINPMFFATEGKFIATYPWQSELAHQYLLPEYTQEEKDSLPDSLLEND